MHMQTDEYGGQRRASGALPQALPALVVEAEPLPGLELAIAGGLCALQA